VTTQNTFQKPTAYFFIAEKTMKTFAEQYIEQGINLGINQGISLGADKLRLEIATKMLAMGCDKSMIQEAINISPEQLNKIAQPPQTENGAENLTPR
jgi:predicted transposase YdaD